ncbi:formylglycine-generating enzyme family protein [Pseudomonas sp. zfem002]|uniref:formylglycine-generating enzyme family protein n=1 Tax=Pseudomonas sp. zfem002 TaxID=3078197 RepID=UPI002928BD28|nr:SUMF1/EgtB/PvdO family nonheme iron enzyme [Pseudomonas sp. zfem002]MDU9394883.1 SUMF1/EgtB/PvdO family nonheme iron enzyme [Pseudomonas sp. zfem002]
MKKSKIILSAVVVLVFVTFSVWIIRDSECSEVNTSSQPAVSEADIESFLFKIKERLVFVKGGSFLMGDFGVSHSVEGLPLDAEEGSKPLHEVVLSDFYIDKYKVTNEDYRAYLEYHGKQLRTDVAGYRFFLFSMPDRLPAHLDWFEAEQYCAWLSDISGLPFSLATEAQWEYAARSRGQFLMVATNDGTYKVSISSEGRAVGVNISTSLDRKQFAAEMGWGTGGLTPLPVDRFPPNPLGVYAMSDSGFEWVKDWYDPDYYKYSPTNDPQGPEQPVHRDVLGRPTKVLRGQSHADEYWTVGINVHRMPANPNAYFRTNDVAFLSSKTARCVVNSGEPLALD